MQPSTPAPSTPARSTRPRRRLLLLDFDGTLCLGDDPVLRYAAAVDAMVADTDHRVTPVVARALSAGDLQGPPAVEPPQDGYQLVQRLAARAGLSREQTNDAFLSARRGLLDEGLATTDLHTPPGAVELLKQVRRTAIVVLVTNSPAEGFSPWLEALGLADSFDLVINDAHKPAGMPEAVRRARAEGDGGPAVTPQQILSVGDIWANDLAHVAELGGTTVLIDRFATGLGEPSGRVVTFSQATQLITTWAGARTV